MCGIAGWLSWDRPPDAAVVGRMTERLRHRGPDAGGLVTRGPVALGHRRLSVIDPGEAANQPMADADERLWIVFNGEIYNYRDLRRELEGAGAAFRTRSDTEVILAAWRRWGAECLPRLNGMFAFALWDGDARRLFLARDRFGEKPLFHAGDGNGGLVFASELGAMREHPAMRGGIEPRALGQYLSLNYTLGDACMVPGVEKLPPAHYAAVGEDGAVRPVRYWDLLPHFRDKGRFRSEAEAAEALAGLLDDSVRLRLVADVPLGAFLSGGIDSAAVAGAMTRAGAADGAGGGVHTFSIGFRERTYDEMDDARATAAALGTAHRDRIVDADLAADLAAVVAACGEPFADTSAIPMYHLARFAREHVTVALSGDGGDELFAGYETYAADRLRRRTAWLPGRATGGLAAAVERLWPASFARVSTDYKLRRFLRGHALDADRAHYYWRVIGDDAEKAAVLRGERRDAVTAADPFERFRAFADEARDLHPLDRAAYVDMKTWLADDILVKLDRTTMAHALEARAPFLDHRLAELAASLPADWKLRGLRGKHVLRRSQRGRLPDAVLARRKQGFNAPVSHWLAGPLHDMARAATTEGAAAEWFDPAAVGRLWDEHAAGRRDHGLRLFGLTCLALWLRQGKPSQGNGTSA